MDNKKTKKKIKKGKAYAVDPKTGAVYTKKEYGKLKSNQKKGLVTAGKKIKKGKNKGKFKDQAKVNKAIQDLQAVETDYEKETLYNIDGKVYTEKQYQELLKKTKGKKAKKKLRKKAKKGKTTKYVKASKNVSLSGSALTGEKKS